jgi:DNA primase
MEVEVVIDAIKRNARTMRPQGNQNFSSQAYPASPETLVTQVKPLEIPRDQRSLIGREVLKIKIQRPDLIDQWGSLAPQAFTFWAYHEIRKLIDEQLTDQGKLGSVDHMLSLIASEDIKKVFSELVSEPIRSDESSLVAYSQGMFFKLQELTTTAELEEVKSTLSRLNPENDAFEYNQVFSRLVELESQRRHFRQQSSGDTQNP